MALLECKVLYKHCQSENIYGKLDLVNWLVKKDNIQSVATQLDTLL